MGSWEWDLASNTVSVSKEMRAMFGFHPTSELAPPRQLAQFVACEDREPFLREVQRAFGEKTVLSVIETRAAEH